LPSFELQSRVDIVDYEYVFTVLYMNLGLVIFFVINEGIEAYVDGFAQYFTNMWNLMDWCGFMLFLALFGQFHLLRASLTENTCDHGAYLCTQLGYHDDWEQFYYTTQVKLFLSLCSTLQMLKVIKFINIFVPKMALATSVLSHGLGDLAMFTIFFLFSIFAFAQMFYIQLGPVLDSYNDMISSFFSLFRALFGDFDIATIMDNSSDYINAVLLILYLFAAIFVLLSIFLTILGEHQGYVRDEEAAAKSAGTNTPDFGLLAFLIAGVKGEVNSCLDLVKEKYMEATNQKSKDERRRDARDNWANVLDMIGASSGGSALAPPRRSQAQEEEAAAGPSGDDPAQQKQVNALNNLVTKQQKLLEQMLKQQDEIKAGVEAQKKAFELEQARQLQRFEELTNNGGVRSCSADPARSHEGSRAPSPGPGEHRQNGGGHHGGGSRRRSHGSGGHSGTHSTTSRGGSSRHVGREKSFERQHSRNGSRHGSSTSSRHGAHGSSMGFLHSAHSANLESGGDAGDGGNGSYASNSPSPPSHARHQSPSRSASGRAVFGA